MGETEEKQKEGTEGGCGERGTWARRCLIELILPRRCLTSQLIEKNLRCVA